MKILATFIISILPLRILRILCYRLFFHYKISFKAKIHFGAFINGKSVKIDQNVSVGPFCFINDVNNIILKKDSRIYRFVIISGLSSFSLGCSSFIGVASKIFSRHIDRALYHIEDGGFFHVGDNSAITANHLFEVLDSIEIKEKVVIGGTGTRFYTHGFDVMGNISHGPILIENNVYIGASTIVNPGIKIVSNVLLASGSVVGKTINDSGIYGGNPVKLIKKEFIFTKKKKYII